MMVLHLVNIITAGNLGFAMDVAKIYESSACNSICSLVIPNYLLDDWYSSRGSGNSFVRRLNDSIMGRALMIKECDTIESRIKVNACKVNHTIKEQQNVLNKY